ncbi:YqgE/AlgH family protein [Geodermatophilus sabuli]|uniref:Putative transcriptional regulator n=1 Tax=Geodermatophilus sabuli TaxID=1564158 RepID=A0A285EHQ0_9ACTN|nr:YqgE/AlgH family protein [Geodermatophilus sabuli]MBB3086242.1 putative transcriptional regulator [Geodermatophilus sabuli]SNX97541.1 putative transcriptional regulator [Geodermatophilus sabuli]
MTPPPSSEPEPGRPTRPATGRRRAHAVPALSIGSLDDVHPGSLLVAMPALTDPTFAGTVVFVLDHSDTGTLGVVLGRPSQVEIRDVLPGWCDLAVEPGVFHVGGPCETDTALCLAVCPGITPAPDSGLRQVAGDVHLVDLDAEPDELDGQVRGLRVFAGYAGWSPGQLAGEVAEGAWACVPGTPDDVLSELAGPDLWRRVMGRQTGRLAVLSTAPADPSVN